MHEFRGYTILYCPLHLPFRCSEQFEFIWNHYIQRARDTHKPRIFQYVSHCLWTYSRIHLHARILVFQSTSSANSTKTSSIFEQMLNIFFGSLRSVSTPFPLSLRPIFRRLQTAWVDDWPTASHICCDPCGAAATPWSVRGDSESWSTRALELITSGEATVQREPPGYSELGWDVFWELIWIIIIQYMNQYGIIQYGSIMINMGSS